MKLLIFLLLFFLHFSDAMNISEMTPADIPDFRSTTTPKPVNLDCQQIKAFYNGTFQNIFNRSLTFDAQLQVTVNINSENKRVNFDFGDSNSKFLNGYGLRLLNHTYYVPCNMTQNEQCSISFDNLPRLWIWFKPIGGGHFHDLIFIELVSNKRFTLLNSVGNCSTTLKYNDVSDSDPSLFKSCFCCGDKYNPDPSLSCPSS